MKIAAIDMGTNSSRLLIVEKDKTGLNVLKRGLIITRLGEGVDSTGQLSAQSIERAVKAVSSFRAEIEKRKVKDVKIVGTSALRDVDNSQQLVKRIKEETSYQLEIISGVEEARLIYQGASLDLAEDGFVVIDIGGGSTEFIWQANNGINLQSLNLGAVRMTERYIANPALPLSAGEYRNIKQQVALLLEENLREKIDRTGAVKAVGVGGTITTLAAMELMLEEYDSNLIQNHQLKIGVVDKLVNQLMEYNLEQRKALAGLQPGRADIITAGAIILQVIFNYLELENITVSEYDILYGLIQEIA